LIDQFEHAAAARCGSGKSHHAWDSFPSGHAIHLGAMAPSAARLAPKTDILEQEKGKKGIGKR
jgi:hypothetical protein